MSLEARVFRLEQEAVQYRRVLTHMGAVFRMLAEVINESLASLGLPDACAVGAEDYLSEVWSQLGVGEDPGLDGIDVVDHPGVAEDGPVGDT